MLFLLGNIAQSAGDPCGGYTCPCYRAEKTTYDVNQSALEWRRRGAFKTGMMAPRPLFCRYQEFVQQQEDPDPQVENGRIMGSAFLHGAEDRQKTSVFCSPLFCRSPTDNSCTFTAFRRWATDCSMAIGCFTMGSTFLHGAEDQGKPGLFSLPLFCRYQGFAGDRIRARDTDVAIVGAAVAIEDRPADGIFAWH